MNTNDPIEDLFRSRSNETVGEKPRDLVWKRIESGLQNEEKKKKPIREFVSSVWFSAAVFALIAIPYFVLFIENINTENRENSLQIVKSDTPIIEQVPVEQEEIKELESNDKTFDNPIEIVKNDKVAKQPVYKVIEEHSVGAAATTDYFPDISSASAPLATTKSKEVRSQILDSIDKEKQFAKVNSNGFLKDSVSKKMNAPVVIRGVSKMKDDTSNVMKISVVAEDKMVNKSLETASVIEVSPKKSKIEKASITYKTSKFTVKSDILRTNFKLMNVSTQNKLVFENSTNSVVITFQKVKDKIILTTNQPKMDAVLLGILEKNKKEIFDYYQR